MSITIPRLRLPRPWTQDHLKALLDVAGELTGCYGSTPRSLWWAAYLHVTHSTGLRPAQVVALDRRFVMPCGQVAIDVRLSPEAMQAIGAIARPDRFELFAVPEEFGDFERTRKILVAFARDGKGGTSS